MTELKWFRLLLLASAAFSIGGGGTWAYSAYQQQRWEAIALEEQEQTLAKVDRCDESEKQNPSGRDCMEIARFSPMHGSFASGC